MQNAPHKPETKTWVQKCLRNLSSTPSCGRGCYRSVQLSGYDLSAHLTDRVAEAHSQNGLTGILQDVHDLPRRSFQVKMLAVGEQMNIGVAADDLGQAFAEFALQETHHFADGLQREAFAFEFADHRDFIDVLHGIEAAMSLTLRLDDSALVPPLKLAGADAGQGDHFS